MSSLLFVYAEHGPLIAESDFNDWFDNRHIPDLLSLTPFIAAQHYTALQTTTPKHLIIYHLSSSSPQTVLTSPEFASHTATYTPLDKQMLSTLPLLNTRFYTPLLQIPPNFPLNNPAQKYLLTAEVDLVDQSPEFEAEFNEWYSGVHIPDITKVPGWVSSRRFKLESNTEGGTNGSTPAHAAKYFALHEFTKGDYMKDPTMIAALRDPRTQSMIPKLKVTLCHFVLQKDFQR